MAARVNRLAKMLGGEEELPSKLPPPPPSPQSTPPKAAPKPESKPNVNASTRGDDWWNSLPSTAADLASSSVKPLPETQSASFPPAAPSGLSAGSLDFDPRRDEPAPRGIAFAPLIAVTKFCYKFVDAELSQPLATAFFDDGKIWKRGWDVYYIWSNHWPADKPFTLVPEQQLNALISDINATLTEDNKIIITEHLRDSGLVLNFDEFDRVELRPRWLGHVTSKLQHDHWVDYTPVLAPLPEVATDSSNVDLEAFRDKMSLASEIVKNKHNKSRKRAPPARKQASGQTLPKARAYLGLQESDHGEAPLADLVNLHLSTPTVDVDAPPPFPCDADVVFIAVDVEAYEREPRRITEVGVATLDTRDLRNVVPGMFGKEWQKSIRARHFRVKEYKQYVNKDFVHGCPDHFEFGKSEFVGKEELPSTLASCFRNPGTETVVDGASQADATEVEKRTVVLVGHDVNQDINYLKSIGFDPMNRANISILDTAELSRSVTPDKQPRSLGTLLYEFDLEGWHLHNAGNDAVYTLWVLLALCVGDSRKEEGSDDSPVSHRKKVMFGPEKPPEGWLGYYTEGGAMLDV